MAEITAAPNGNAARATPRRPDDRSLSRTPKSQQATLKRKFRGRLARLDGAMIRRHRISYHEALCTELQENGYARSAYYVRSLVRFDEEVRNAHGPDTFVWMQPTLAGTTEHLDALRACLEEAERARRNGDPLAESRSFLRAGVHFTRQPATWWWIAEQLLLESIHVAAEYPNDDHRQETIARYVFGRFLVLQLGAVDDGRDQLKMCREYSTSKRWTAADVLGAPQGTIFVECCTLLSRVMFEQARAERETDANKAFRTAAIALKRATETDNDAVRAKGHLELGVCKLHCDSAAGAIETFETSLELYKGAGDVAGACEALMHLATAHTKLDTPDALDTCERHLLDMIALAATDGAGAHWSGTAHERTGLFYLNYGRNDDGREHLSAAFETFRDAGAADETLRTRCLAGIAAGQNLFETYARTVRKASRHDARMENVMRIVGWKDANDPFWAADGRAPERSMTDVREVASTLSVRTIVDEMLAVCG